MFEKMNKADVRWVSELAWLYKLTNYNIDKIIFSLLKEGRI